MLKLSQIEEGLWNKGLNRTKSGEKRLGDITELDKYIDNVTWVDLGHKEYLFAKLEYNELFTVEDILNMSFPKDIKFMDYDLFNWIFEYSDKTRSTHVDGSNFFQNEVESHRTGEIVYFIKTEIMKYVVNIEQQDKQYKIDFVQPCHSLDNRTAHLNKSYINDYKFAIKLVKKK